MRKELLVLTLAAAILVAGTSHEEDILLDQGQAVHGEPQCSGSPLLNRVRIAAPADGATVQGPFQIRVDFASGHVPWFDSPSSLASEFTVYVDGNAAHTSPITDPRRPYYILGIPGLPVGVHVFEVALTVPEDEPYRARIQHRISLYSAREESPPLIQRRRRIACKEIAVPVRGGGGEGSSDLSWCSNETAVLVLDMWAQHECLPAQLRIAEIAPRLNQALVSLRDAGVFILHTPSAGVESMAPSYTTQRARMAEAECHSGADLASCPASSHHGTAAAAPPSEPALPVKAGGCDGEITGGGEVGGIKVERNAWPSHDQHPSIFIFPQDGLSDNPREIFGFMAGEGIKNIVLAGVHADECVLKRPYGARGLRRAGFNVVLARDFTDALYDPRDPPHVSHRVGTAMVLRHVESHVCGTVLMRDIVDSIESEK